MDARRFHGDRRTVRPGAWALAAAVLLSVLPGAAQAAERVALVIGNGAYKNVSFLANPGNDARDVGDAFERLGYSVTRAENAGHDALRRTLRDFKRAAGASEVAVVFYAGHGIEVDKGNYLVPVDAKLAHVDDVKYEAVPLDWAMDAVGGAQRLGVVILDACRNNPFAESMQTSGTTRSVGRGLARVAPSGATLVAYAAKDGTTADDDAGKGHSPYTEALLAHIETPGLDVGRMFRNVRDAVVAETGGRQEPVMYGSLPGRDIYLASGAPGGGTADKTPPPPPPSDAARAYEAAERVGTVAAYRAVIKRFPGSFEAELAQAQIDKLEEEPLVVAGGGPVGEGSAVVPSPAEVERRLGLSREERRLVQMGLSAAGYDPGLADGVFGGRTREALRAWQESKRMEGTGRLTEEQSEGLVALGREEGARLRAEAERRRAEAEREAREAEERRRAEAERKEREAEARRRADDEAFGRAKSEGTVRAFEGYLSSCGEWCGHGAEARRLKRGAELEERREREREPGRKFRDCAGCPEMVVVPAGSFMMGSPSGERGRDGDEGPVHRVRIGEPFAVGVYEVTFEEWEACVSGGGCWGYRPSDEGWGRGRRPVINVDWEDAQAYVEWLSEKTGEGYRLLSESEWEYVARAGTGTRYWWGDGIGRNQANCDGCGSRWDDRQTAPVGSFAPNGFGLYDVHGNVWEWVEDCWNGSYAGAPVDGSAWESGNCDVRVLRGGSWYSVPGGLRSAVRFGDSAGYRISYFGFRVARTLTP